MSLAAAATLLQTALVLLALMQAHPEFPQSARDNAIAVAQNAIQQATTALTSAPKSTSSGIVFSAPTPIQPFSHLSASLSSGQAPLSVTFTGSAVGPYTLDLADGSTTVSTSTAATCAGCIGSTSPILITHTFAKAGIYPVTLFDENGTKTATVSVYGTTLSRDPIASTTPLVGDSHTIVFSGMLSPMSSCAASSSAYMLSYGDFSSIDITVPAGNCSDFPFSVSHTYSKAGTYTYRLDTTSLASHQAGGAFQILSQGTVVVQ